jgi:hypothetical protein
MKVMKKYFTNTFTVIGIIFTLIFVIIWQNNDYLAYRERECVVIDKLQTIGSESFILVMQEDRGIIFDRIVSPATYSQLEEGNTAIFDLRDFDINQTTKNNLIYVFGQFMFGLFGIAFLFIGLLVPKD